MGKQRKHAGPVPVEWFAIGGRLAVAAGAGCALLSLLWDAPPSAAAFRGALAWFAVRTYFRFSARFLNWRLRMDGREAEQRAAGSRSEAA